MNDSRSSHDQNRLSSMRTCLNYLPRQSVITVTAIMFGAPDVPARLILFVIDVATFGARDIPVFTCLALFDVDPTLLSFETNRFAGG